MSEKFCSSSLSAFLADASYTIPFVLNSCVISALLNNRIITFLICQTQHAIQLYNLIQFDFYKNVQVKHFILIV